MSTKVSTPQGTRDFDAVTIYKRQFIQRTIQKHFSLAGYQPLETPAFENLTTLMGKYGDEGDKLIFKILNNGLSDPAKAEKVNIAWQDILQGKNNTIITERALRYDLTIPFARYVVMNQGNLAFPFKRYQMQPVWRADRPQKGRYREFWQCDADVVGSNSLIHEAELLQMYSRVFDELKIPQVTIRINNRKILEGLAISIGKPDHLTALTVAIDKLDKIGMDKVKDELLSKGFDEQDWNTISRFLNIQGENQSMLSQAESLLADIEVAQKGIAELKEIISNYTLLNPNTQDLQIDFKLARGLNYYTGMITEVTTSAVLMGSIGGGGRYDDLTGLFGLKNLSGVGISFGLDRIYDVMESLQLFPENISNTSKVMFLPMTQQAVPQILGYLNKLRAAGIASEVYTEFGKFDKQMKYANKKGVPFVGIIGEDELNQNVISLKNMNTGEQSKYTFDEMLNFFLTQIHL